MTTYGKTRQQRRREQRENPVAVDAEKLMTHYRRMQSEMGAKAESKAKEAEHLDRNGDPQGAVLATQDRYRYEGAHLAYLALANGLEATMRAARAPSTGKPS